MRVRFWSVLNLGIFLICAFVPISFVVGLVGLGSIASESISTISISSSIRFTQRTAFLTEAWWATIAVVLTFIVGVRAIQLAILQAEYRATRASDDHNHTAADGVCACGFWENGNRAAFVIFLVAMVTFPMIAWKGVSQQVHWVFAFITIAGWLTHNWMVVVMTVRERRLLYDGCCKVYLPVVVLVVPTVAASVFLLLLIVELGKAGGDESKVDWLAEWLCVFALCLFFLPYAFMFQENPVDDELREYARRLSRKLGCCVHNHEDAIHCRNHQRRQASWRQTSYRAPGKLSDAHKQAEQQLPKAKPTPV